MIAEQIGKPIRGDCCYRVGASAHGGDYLVNWLAQSGSGPSLAHALKARQISQPAPASRPYFFVAREIEIKVLAHEAVRHPANGIADT